MDQGEFCLTGHISTDRQLLPCYYTDDGQYSLMEFGYNNISNARIRVPPNMIVTSSDGRKYVGSYVFESSFDNSLVNASEIVAAPSSGYNVESTLLDDYLSACAQKNDSATPLSCDNLWGRDHYSITNYVTNFRYVIIAANISLIIIVLVIIVVIMLYYYENGYEIEI